MKSFFGIFKKIGRTENYIFIHKSKGAQASCLQLSISQIHSYRENKIQFFLTDPLQPRLFFGSVGHALFKFLHQTFIPKPEQLESLNFERRLTSPHLSCVMCHVSQVTCNMSHVTCHISHVTCHILFLAPQELKRWPAWQAVPSSIF